jgi:hypothetical protein
MLLLGYSIQIQQTWKVAWGFNKQETEEEMAKITTIGAHVPRCFGISVIRQPGLSTCT